MPDRDLSARADAKGLVRRSMTLDDFEFRASDDADTWTFEGIACTVDHPYSVRDWMGEYTETIAAGAFNRTLADPNAKVSLHVNHQYGQAQPLATRTAGTLKITADPHLTFRADLDPARPDVQILRSVLTRGEMNEMSIGFGTVKGGSEWNADYTEVVRTDLRLREASIVEDGCNDLTTASIRSLTSELARFNGHDIDDGEVRRAIMWLEGLLRGESDEQDAERVADVVEQMTGSGLVVTDELIAATARRHGIAA